MEETLAYECKAKLTQMVGSGTSGTEDRVKNQSIWFVFVYWLLSTSLFTQSAYAQFQTKHTFLISSTSPYSLPNHQDSSGQSLSTTQVAQLAAECCGGAKLVSSDSKTRSIASASFCTDDASGNEIRNSFQLAMAYRLRQTASANALKLHFGIAAGLTAERMLNETEVLLKFHDKAQKELGDKGVPIPDPLLVERLRIVLDDKRLENQSKMAVARSQLSALIGTENACGHAPAVTDELVPSDCDVCERIQQALSCRCDLLTMKRLRGTVNADTLAVWEGFGALLSGAPHLIKSKPLWTKWIQSNRSKREIENEIAARRKWLDELIAERTKQISLEVDIAFEKKRSAAMRWAKSTEQIANWDTRISQLESLSEVQGNMASQFESKLNRFQAKGQRIERWAEWHQANVDLLLAIGCNL